MNIISTLIFIINQLICNAHIFIQDPPSRYNKYSEYYVSNNLVNYDLKSPLNVDPDYFTFPCKGFPIGPPTKIYQSNSISITLEGTAIHGGGHCQFGISYDNKEFVVLKTVFDTCLLDTLTYTLDLPENIPSGDIIIFWTWINRIGNREYYMECADISLNNGNQNNVDIIGKELLVVNLPGYSVVGEWNPGDSDLLTGKDLLLQRQTKILKVNQNQQNLPSETISPKPKPKPIPSSVPTQPPKYKKKEKNKKYKQRLQENENRKTIDTGCENDGYMKCSGNGFMTCVYNDWVYRECGSGTKCKEFQSNYIICDYLE